MIRITMQNGKTIDIELDHSAAPITCENFEKLVKDGYALYVDAKTGEPYANPILAVGNEVSVIGLKANPVFRTEKGIAILGPRYFKLDFDYTPIEEVMSK